MGAINSKPNDAPTAITLSHEAAEMLRAIGKNHLREVSDEEWARYSAKHAISDLLCAEYWDWHCPDVEVLKLIHGTDARDAAIHHWISVQNRTSDIHVRQHAQEQIKQLEGPCNEH
jgi:hypothetical protein